MGMCKQCREVFSALEMEEGLCKNCITPELLEIERNKPSKKNNSGVFSKIESRDDALKTIKDVTIIFTIIGVFNILMAFNSETKFSLIDGIIYLVLAGSIWKWHSIIASIMLVVVLSVSIFGIVLRVNSGVALLLEIILIVIAIRSVEATYNFKIKWQE